MLLDLHVHTSFSPDCLSSPKDLVDTAKRRGLHGVAVTDHDTVRGGLEARRHNRDRDFHVIVGSEITTDAGDIIGLFLEAEIHNCDALEVIREIHEQGGLALLPHPFRGRPPREEVVRAVDLVEVFNARMDPASNGKAQELARRLGKRSVCASDAHFLSDLGTCSVLLEDTDIRTGLLRGAIALHTGYSPRYRTSASQIIKAWRSGNYSRVPYHAARMLKRMLRP
jgi:predicted metal-dependent phosphoesterase TrpH